MADFGVAEGIALAGVLAGTGASVYAASQAGKTPNLPKPVTPDLPKKPDEAPLTANMQQADIAAKTAGGTVLSKPGAVGDASNVVRKSLLGQ